MRLTLIAVLACAFVARAGDKDEVKKLEGTWTVTGLQGGGMDIPFAGKLDKLTVKDGVMSGFGSDVKLSTDATKKPKWLNMTASREGKELTVNAIYELDGDELRIAMPLAPGKGSGKAFENKRPENFDSTGKPVMVIKAKRAK